MDALIFYVLVQSFGDVKKDLLDNIKEYSLNMSYLNVL